MRVIITLLALAGVVFAATAEAAPVRDKTFPWRAWDVSVFEEARRDKNYVLLSLQSWWRPWRHTMNENIFGDKAIRDALAKHFVDEATGAFWASTPNLLLPKPAKQKDDNVAAVRFFNLLKHYTGAAQYGVIAEVGMGYLTSAAVTDAYLFLPGVLLAEQWLTHKPVKATIVGAKDDPKAARLHLAALAYPTEPKASV